MRNRFEQSKEVANEDGIFKSEHVVTVVFGSAFLVVASIFSLIFTL